MESPVVASVHDFTTDAPSPTRASPTRAELQPLILQSLDSETPAGASEHNCDEMQATGSDIMPPTPAEWTSDKDIVGALAQDDLSEDDFQTVGASEHDEDQHDELHAVGFALAQSAACLLESTQAQLCLDVAEKKIMTGACTPEDRQALHHCATAFFLRKPDGAPKNAAYTLKTPTELADAWKTILTKRREMQPDDRVPITDSRVCATMHNQWSREFQELIMSPEQRANKLPKQRTSAFNAYLNKNFGGKKFIMAVWQSGISWAPPPDMMENDRNGALEHVAKHFAKWVRRLARGLAHAKEQPEYKNAKRKSTKGGLTAEEQVEKAAREDARKNFWWATRLKAELDAARSGKGWSKGKNPRNWHEFTNMEQWGLRELASGELLAKKMKAEATSSYTQAKDLA